MGSKEVGVYRTWTSPSGFAPGKQDGQELAMIPGNPNAKFPRKIAETAIAEYFSDALRRALPNGQSEGAKISFTDSDGQCGITIRVPAKLPDGPAAKFTDDVSAEILDGVLSGKYLRR
jgi:hypothetical protein